MPAVADSWRAIGVALLTTAVLVVCASGRQAGIRAQTTVTTSTEGIWVTVSVIDKDSHLVTNLTKDDFEIRDNGIARGVGSFRNDVIPFALAIMIDLSSSMGTNFSTMRRGITELMAKFEPGDRAVIGGFDGLPWIAPKFSGNAQTLAQGLTTITGGTAMLCDGPWIDHSRNVHMSGGRSMGDVPMFLLQLQYRSGSAIWDGMECGINAVASDGETPRRVVLAVTDGGDNMSSSTQADVIRDANAAGVMVYTVGMLGDGGLAAADLRGISEQTGGGYYFLSNREDLVGAFSQIADELRHQYVLGFSSGDSASAKHDVSVRVVNRPELTVRSRRVYLGAMPSAFKPPARTASGASSVLTAPMPSSFAPPAGAAPTALPPVPVTIVRTPLWDTFDRFVAGDWTPGGAPMLSPAELASTFADLRRDAPAWVRAGAPADQPRQRLAIATVVLDLLYSQRDPLVWRENQPAVDLIEWAGNALRSGAAESGERLWYGAAIALLERNGAAASLDRLVAHAQDRFPKEERWTLARAIAQELRTWPEPRDVHPLSVDGRLSATIRARYEEAAALASVRDEALIRLGYFELRSGRVDAALKRLADAGTPDDPYLRYWLHLFQGRAYERSNRLDDAIAAYQRAFDDAPFAQSATSALSGALLMAGRQAEAARLAARALTVTPTDDPWTTYGVPDSRFWSALVEALRRIVAP